MTIYNLIADQYGLFACVQRLLQINAYALPAGILRRELLCEPLYPDVLAVAQVLKRTGIPYDLVQIPLDVLPQIDAPLLIRRSDTEDFLLINYQAADQVAWQDGKSQGTCSITQLAKFWDGVALYVEPSGQAPVSGGRENRGLSVLAGLALVCCLSALLLKTFFFAPMLLWLPCLLLLAAFGISLAQLAADVGFGAFAERLCGVREGEPSDCTKLSRQHGFVFPGVRWSMLGTISFLFLLLLLLILPMQDPAAPSLLFYCAAPGLLLSLYSLYLQGSKGIWCRLCLMVSGLFWLATGMLYLSVDSFSLPEAHDLLLLLAAGGLSSLIGFLIQTRLEQEVATMQETRKWRQLLQLEPVREQFLQTLPQVQFEGIPYLQESLPRQLYFMSLSCPHCRESFETMDRSLDLQADPAAIGWVVTDGTSLDAEDRALAVYLFGCYQEGLREEARELLRAWYGSKKQVSGNAFIKQQVPSEKLQDFNSRYTTGYEEMSHLIKSHDLHHYPGLYYEGRRVPSVFALNELN